MCFLRLMLRQYLANVASEVPIDEILNFLSVLPILSIGVEQECSKIRRIESGKVQQHVMMHPIHILGLVRVPNYEISLPREIVIIMFRCGWIVFGKIDKIVDDQDSIKIFWCWQ